MFVPGPDPSLFEKDSHPRLFFGPDDIALLREKAKEGTPARCLAEMLRRCERYTDPSSPDFVDPTKGIDALLEGFGGGQPNNSSDALHCLAFAHVLTDDARWSDHAAELLRGIISQEEPSETGGFETNVCYSSFAGQVTYAFDLLYHVLPEEDRNALESYIRERVVNRYEENVLVPPDRHSWGQGTNTFLRNFEKYTLGLAAVYRPNDDADARRITEIAGRLRQAIHRGIDEGGAIYEGPSYGWRDAEWYAFMAEILFRIGAADLWHEEPRFAAFYRHWGHLVLPCGRGQNNYCDSHRLQGGRPHTGMLLSARRLDDPVLQWVYGKLGGRGEYGDLGPSPECFKQNLGQTLLWEDDDVTPVPPDQAGWPSSRVSGRAGVITMRTGWGDNDTCFSMLASTRTHGNHIHQQTDSGHFCFLAMGEAFSMDSGYGDIMGMYHSVMRPGGEEPSRGPRGFGHMFFGGRMEAFASGTGADYACVNNAEQWECHWAYRHAMLVKAPGAEPYVIILDNMNHGGDYETYEWLMNSALGNTIDVDGENERATVDGNKNRLEAAWSYPAADEYPKPHALQLSADEIDSQPPGYGIGRRPRLIARLLGYNGMLLSALIPRRASAPEAGIERLAAREQFGLRISHGDVVDTIVASAHNGNISVGELEGEAVLTVCRTDNGGKLLWWAAAQACALSFKGRTLLDRRGESLILAEGAEKDL